MKDLGQFAKEIGLKKNLEVADIKSPCYIKPNMNANGMVAKSADYVVVMHFSPQLRVVGNSIKEDYIDKAYDEYQFNHFKMNNTHLNPKMANQRPHMTFMEPRTGDKIDYAALRKQVPGNIEMNLRKQGNLGGVNSMHPVSKQGDQFFKAEDLSMPSPRRDLQVNKKAPRDGTGGLTTQPQATDARDEESEQYEVESEGQTRAKVDEIYN